MSGHSKWATTKHRKAAQDAKRSALFSKLSRNITVAAKEGGDPNPANNASLAAAIEKAKGYSLPKDKIKTAIDKAFGTGKDAANYETLTYEGYGPAGVAILCEALTDNRNRTAADVGAAFRHHGGNLGTPGCVSFQFERKGQIMVEKVIKSDDKKVADKENAVDEDEFMMMVAECGGILITKTPTKSGSFTPLLPTSWPSRTLSRLQALRPRVQSSPWSPPLRPRFLRPTPKRSCVWLTSSKNSKTFRTSITPWT